MTKGTPFGKDYKIKEYKPSGSTFNYVNRYSPTPKDFKAPKKDTLKVPEYKSSKFQATNENYEYKPYKPSNVGMYGEKEKEKKKPVPKSSPRAAKPKPEVAKQTTGTRRKLKTFKCYEDPSGPDIKIKRSGPDLPIREYKYKDPDLLHRPPVEVPFKEPLKPEFKSGFENRRTFTPKKFEEYKLTEKNNLGMRHWHTGLVDDTIMRRQLDYREHYELVPQTPEKKPAAVAQPLSKKSKENKPSTPVKAEHVHPIVAPVPAPLAKKKKLVNSSTQHVSPKNKTSETQTNPAPIKSSATQYEKAGSKNINIQTDTPPLPVVAAGTVMGPPLNTVKSKSVQASEPQKVATAGTQYAGPKTKQATIQTSPVMFATQQERRVPSPERAYVEPVQARQISPESLVYRRAPSPEAEPRTDTPPNKSYTPPRQSSDSGWTPPPAVPVVVPVRHDTPPRRQDTPPRTHTPQRSNPQNEMYRLTPPNRLETPPHIQTPPRLESPPKWQSPNHFVTPAPRERAASPPQTQQRYSPDYRSPPPVMPVVIPVQQQPQANDPYVYEPARNQSYAHVPPAPKPPTPTKATPVTPKRLSPDRTSLDMPRETTYTVPPDKQSAPPVQQPYFSPRRDDPTPPRQSPTNGNAFQGFLPRKTQMRLPPEVNACIEAYDNAHSEPVRRSGGSLSSFKRTLRFA